MHCGETIEVLICIGHVQKTIFQGKSAIPGSGSFIGKILLDLTNPLLPRDCQPRTEREKSVLQIEAIPTTLVLNFWVERED